MTAAPVEKRVDTLRRAAALMRERAEKAEASWPSPWFYSERHSEVHHSGANGAYDRPYVSGADGWHADEHQASWHPRVALAAAEMLEEFARLDDQGIHPPTSVVTLAKRYLGETS